MHSDAIVKDMYLSINFQVHLNANIQISYDAQRAKRALLRFTENVGPDQPAHLCRLIRTFVVRLQ